MVLFCVAIIIIIIIRHTSFSSWSLSTSKFSHVFRTLHSTLVDLNYAVV